MLMFSDTITLRKRVKKTRERDFTPDSCDSSFGTVQRLRCVLTFAVLAADCVWESKRERADETQREKTEKT